MIKKPPKGGFKIEKMSSQNNKLEQTIVFPWAIVLLLSFIAIIPSFLYSQYQTETKTFSFSENKDKDIVQYQIIEENTVLASGEIINPEYRKNKEEEIIEVIITGYSSTPWETDEDPYITASGKYVHEGIVAANFLPFGTKIIIPELYGNKIFVVEDRMHHRYWYNIDIWFPSHEEALEFGAKKSYIKVIKN